MSTPAASDRPATLTLEFLREVIRHSPFSAWMGAEPSICSDGQAELRIRWRPEFGQHHGYLHGSLVGFLADSACAWAAASVAGDVVTAQYDLRLLAPGIGEAFIARGRVIKASRRQVVTEAQVYAVRNASEKLIATATATILPVGEPAEVERSPTR